MAKSHPLAGGRTHGEARTYDRGCHCDLCKKAHREKIARNRAERKARLEQGFDSERHGRATTYDDGCRCPACSEAKVAYKRGYDHSELCRCSPCLTYRRKVREEQRKETLKANRAQREVERAKAERDYFNSLPAAAQEYLMENGWTYEGRRYAPESADH
jgi:hypothetical protein